MSNNNLQKELQEAQQKKIDYFCEIINNNNISQAEYYLNKANWNENLAIEYFWEKQDNNNQNQKNNSKINNNYNKHEIKRNSSAKIINQNNNKINNNINQKNLVFEVFNQDKKYMEFNIDIFINDKENKGSHYTHDKYLLYIKNNLKNVETNFKMFLQKIKNIPGIILIFNEEKYFKIKEQINQINILKEKLINFIIFPVSVNSKEGLDFILGLSCVSFPSYIFCKFKNENNIYITDRMEGAFELAFLEESIKKIMTSFKPMNNENKKKPNMKNVPKPQINSKKKHEEDIFNNVWNNFKNNGPIKKNKFEMEKSKNQKEKRIPIPSKKYNKNDKKSEMDINIINFNNNKENIFPIDNDNIVKHDDSKKMNDNSNIEKEKDKELNYQDFFLGDSIEIPKLFGYYNNNSNNSSKKDNIIDEKHLNNNINNENKNISNFNENNQNIQNNNNDNLINSNINDVMLRDSIYNLSDGQILAKREQEMRRLEQLQEEKEKKEKEEKMKQIEEEKKIKKYEKEAEYAKMILAPEPEENNPDTCHIKFRLPEGEKIMERKFLKTDKISVLYDYVKSIGREIFMEPDANDFNIIVMGFPPKNLENLKNNSLEEEGLHPNSILQIEEK